MAFIVLLNFKGLNLNGTRVQADDKNAAGKSAK